MEPQHIRPHNDRPPRPPLEHTTKEWILENLGSPASINDLGDDQEVLQYVSVEKKEGELGIFIVGKFEETKEQSESFFVTLKNGIVQDFGRRWY